MYIITSDKITIRWWVEPLKKPYIPPADIKIRYQGGNVIFTQGHKSTGMTTVTAHRIGYNMAMQVPKLLADEVIVLQINGERIEMIHPVAKKVSAALLVKADHADDYQLTKVRRVK